MFKRTQLLAAIVGLSFASGVARAGTLMEVFFADDATGMPSAVEVFGIDPTLGATLVVIHARASGVDHGDVAHSFRIDGTQSLRLVTESLWPTDLWPDRQPSLEAQLVPSNTPADGFDFGPFGRTLLLFDRELDLIEDSANIFTDPQQQQRVDGAVLMDWLTFGPNAEAMPLDAVEDFGTITLGRSLDPDGEAQHILDTALGSVFSRPFNLDGTLAEDWLVGEPTSTGTFAFEPTYDLTPGAINPRWEGIATPEPTTAGLLVVAGLLVLRPGARPRREARSGSCTSSAIK